MFALSPRPLSLALAAAGAALAVAAALRCRRARPVVWTAGATVWTDDHTRPLAADHGEYGPDGLRHCYTLAAFLEEEAEEREGRGADFDLVVAHALRWVAADARRRGALTADEYLRKVR